MWFLKFWTVARPCPWMARPGLAETVVVRPGVRWPGRARGWPDPVSPKPWFFDPGVGGPAVLVDGTTRLRRNRGFSTRGSVARPCPWMARPGFAETVVFRPGGRWPGRARGWPDPAWPKPWFSTRGSVARPCPWMARPGVAETVVVRPGVGGPAVPVNGPTRLGRNRGFSTRGSVARPCPWMARTGLAETVVFRPGGRWPGRGRGWDSLLIVLQEMCFCLPRQKTDFPDKSGFSILSQTTRVSYCPGQEN